ncbi:MAG TPA: hypothetical protein VG941_01720 [Candidatus Paceibacterota bacterium]|nr:hypothetical protein [Candidatus Paceibacterota bacterium]
METLLSFAGLSTGISSLVGILSSILVQFLAVVISIFNYALYLRAFNDMPVITTTWTILRNFSNMLFIVLLIWMAFATIFDSSKYSFQKMIGRFLIVAVLINFSLVIGGLIIDASQVLTNVFLGAIGNPGDKLGQYLSAVNLVGLSPGTAASTYGVDAFSADTVSAIMRLVLTAMFLFSLLVATFFAIIRIFIIWGLLIVSPLAWMAYILPGTQKRFYQWMGLFFGWNLFLPIYLFFLYLTIFFLSQRDQIVAQVGFKIAQDGTNGLDKGLVSGIVNSTSFNLIFFYIFAAFMLSAGTLWAVQLTSAWTGVDFRKRVDSIKGLVNRIPGFSDYQAARKAASQKATEAYQNTFGRRAQEQQNRWNAAFGVQGAQFKNQRDFVSRVDKETSKLKEQEQAGSISISQIQAEAKTSDPNSARGAALRSILYDRGMIDEAEFKKDVVAWSDKPFLVQSMSDKAKKSKFKNVAPKELLKMAAAEGEYQKLRTPEMTATRKAWFDFIKADDKALGAITLEQYSTAISLMGGIKTKEGQDFRKAVGKKRPDIAVMFDMRDRGYKVEQNKNLYRRLLRKEIKGMSTKDIAGVGNKIWEDPAFQDALALHIKVLQDEDPKRDPEKGKKGAKGYAGGGAAYKTTLRKNLKDNKKRKILKDLAGTDISDLEGEEIKEEAAAGGGGEEKSEKKEEPKT